MMRSQVSASDSTYGAGTQSSPGHTEYGPSNISRWLIQRLVTSNYSAGLHLPRVQQPSVMAIGLLGPVVKAILLDHERSLALAVRLIFAWQGEGAAGSLRQHPAPVPRLLGRSGFEPPEHADDRSSPISMHP